MTDGGMTSAGVPARQATDHVRGDPDQAVLLYADFTCPRCALAWLRLADRPLVFRHFALTAKDARCIPLACAAEAAAGQDAFWAFADGLFGDPGRTDDPHLWARAEALGLDVQRFEADRRSEATAEHVRRQTREAMRAGIVATPAVLTGREWDAPLDWARSDRIDR